MKGESSSLINETIANQGDSSDKLDVVVCVLRSNAILTDNVRRGLAEILSDVGESIARARAYYDQNN